MIDVRGNPIRVVLPDPTPLGLGDELAELAAAAADLARLRRELRDAQSRVTELERAQGVAERTDLQAHAEAIRAGNGKAWSGGKARAKLEAEREAARTAVKAHELAFDTAQEEVIDLVELRREAWLAAIEPREDETDRDYAMAVEAMVVARDRRNEFAAFRLWVERFPDQLSVKPVGSYLRGLIGQNGDPFFAATVIDALRAEANTTRPPSIRAAVRALMPRFDSVRPLPDGADPLGPD